MKTLKNNIYKDIATVLISDNKEFKTNQRIILLARTLSIYPSKSIYYQVASRLINFMERNINSISLIIEVMRDEGEDEEIITNIEFLKDNPSISTSAEVKRLFDVLVDYVRYAEVLKKKNSFIQALDIVDDETNIKQNVMDVYKLAKEICIAYESLSNTEVAHTFDTNEKSAMQYVVAQARDANKPDRIILTRSRGINQLLSPGYCSGKIYVWAGSPGHYKSGILLDSHIDTCIFNPHLSQGDGKKKPISIYITMENTMAQTINRMWSILFPTADISMFTVEESCEMIDKELTKHGVRSVLLYFGYREKSTADIQQIVNAFNDDENEVIALWFDYIKRVRSARTDAAVMGSEKSELHAIMNEFKTMAVQLNIPIGVGHQLNRMADAEVDAQISKGGYNQSDKALGRAHVGTAFEVVEVADWLGLIRIENNGEQKNLMVKVAKQRDQYGEVEASIVGVRHPFLTVQSFALKSDILEQVMVAIPIYLNRQVANYMAASI